MQLYSRCAVFALKILSHTRLCHGANTCVMALATSVSDLNACVRDSELQRQPCFFATVGLDLCSSASPVSPLI